MPSRDRGVDIERREPLQAFEGALDGGTVDLEALGQLGQARFGRLTTRVGNEPDDVRLLLQAPVAFERRDRVQLPASGTHRALKVG